jgi:hypothetical protein
MKTKKNAAVLAEAKREFHAEKKEQFKEAVKLKLRCMEAAKKRLALCEADLAAVLDKGMDGFDQPEAATSGGIVMGPTTTTYWWLTPDDV